MALSKEQIIAAKDLQTRVLNVPEWGGDVHIAQLSGAERAEYEERCHKLYSSNSANEQFESVALFCAYVLRGDDGSRLFDEGDVAALLKKSQTAIERVFNAGLELNAMRQGDVEAIEKN